MDSKEVHQRVTQLGPKIGYRRIARNTDARSFIGAVIPTLPCGDSVFILHIEEGNFDLTFSAIAMLNSFVFDWNIRQRLAGTNLNWHVLAEGIIPRRTALPLSRSVQSLNLFSNQLSQSSMMSNLHTSDALLLGERVRLRSLLDAVAAAAYGCTADDLQHILRDIDLPSSEYAKRSPRSSDLDARGFWRSGRDLSPELRHSVLTLVALRNLESMGKIEAFVSQNHDDGWLLPESLCLAEHGLGYDLRARSPQPVASKYGSRFFDWQLAYDPSMWDREREVHAYNRGEMGRSKESRSETQHYDGNGSRVPTTADRNRGESVGGSTGFDQDAVSRPIHRELFDESENWLRGETDTEG